jgi:hypothetical protein
VVIVSLIDIDFEGGEQLAALGYILPDSVTLWRTGGLNRLLACVRSGEQLVKLTVIM